MGICGDDLNVCGDDLGVCYYRACASLSERAAANSITVLLRGAAAIVEDASLKTLIGASNRGELLPREEIFGLLEHEHVACAQARDCQIAIGGHG